MTPKFTRRSLASAALATLMYPLATMAAPVAVTSASSPIVSPGASGNPTGDLLLQTLEQLRSDRAEPLATTLTTTNDLVFRQSTPALRNPLSSSLRSGSDLFLWNFVALIHAQQVERPFDLVDTNLTAIAPLQAAVVSTVPLPASIWLFIIGGLGLAGARMGSGSQERESSRHKTSTQPTLSGVSPA